MVTEHRKWDLHESGVGGVGGQGPLWGDAEGPRIAVQSPEHKV